MLYRFLNFVPIVINLYTFRQEHLQIVWRSPVQLFSSCHLFFPRSATEWNNCWPHKNCCFRDCIQVCRLPSNHSWLRTRLGWSLVSTNHIWKMTMTFDRGLETQRLKLMISESAAWRLICQWWFPIPFSCRLFRWIRIRRASWATGTGTNWWGLERISNSICLPIEPAYIAFS